MLLCSMPCSVYVVMWTQETRVASTTLARFRRQGGSYCLTRAI